MEGKIFHTQGAASDALRLAARAHFQNSGW